MAEAQRRVALSASNATTFVANRDSREATVFEYVRKARHYNATVVSLPAILIPELIRDDTAAAARQWVKEHGISGDDQGEVSSSSSNSNSGIEAVVDEEHFWPISGWCDDTTHPRARFDEQGEHYMAWMAQAMTHALELADAVARAEDGGAGAEAEVELPEPLDEVGHTVYPD